jgi:hypothetical protein
LEKPNGSFRLLHAAAAEFRRQGLSIGSGVTEAACKTVFTQRVKFSGMRWSREGAQVILSLRMTCGTLPTEPPSNPYNNPYLNLPPAKSSLK